MIRAYDSTLDFDIISEWVAERGLPPLPTGMMPEHGVVYFDKEEKMSAAAWVYLDRQAGVGFPHWMITRKGMLLSDSRKAVSEVIAAIQQIAALNNIHTLLSTVHQDGIARECINQFGWQYLGQGATLYLPCHS
jgi:hypothetical protein